MGMDIDLDEFRMQCRRQLVRPVADRADIENGKVFVQISAGPFGVDLVFAPDGIESYDVAARNPVRVENFPVMAIADIIASKRAAGRRRELAEIDLLEEFRQEFERRR